MNTLLHSIFNLAFMGSLAMAQEAALFSGGLGENYAGVQPGASVTATHNNLFKAEFGSSTPARMLQAMRGTANADAIISSQTYRTYAQNVTTVFGDNGMSESLLAKREGDLRTAVKANNIASTRSLNIKGDLAESMMDDFYKKDGWEKLDGKRGRNGFDGLYVKRSPSGRITQWMPVDAKAGSSKLNMTKRGMQLSPEWCKANAKDLLRQAEQAYAKSPTQANLKRLNDYKQLGTSKMRKPRVFSMRIEKINGKPCFVMRNTYTSGHTAYSQMEVDMQSPKGTRVRRTLLNNLEKTISNYGGVDAHKLRQKLETAFAKGKITSDSDMHNMLKRNISNSQLRREVASTFGFKNRVPSFSGNTSKIGAFVKFGEDILSSKAGRTVLAVADPASFAVEQGSKYAGQYVAKQMYGSATGKAAARLGAQFAKAGLGALEGVVGGFMLADIYSQYNSGQMSQTAFLVESSTTLVATAGGIFLTCTEMGTGIGTAIFPGAGSLAGAAVGAILGGICTGVTVAYNYFESSEREELAKMERQYRAEADAAHAKAQMEKARLKLREEGERLIREGWAHYNSTQL